MRSTIAKVAGAATAAALVSGCATVLRGTKQDYAITSAPPGATVATSTDIACITPCALKLKRKQGFSATFTLPGYETQTAEVESVFTGSAALAGNAMFGGLIGAAVDASNGSLNSLSPNPLNVDLVPVGASTPVATGTAAGTDEAPVAVDDADDAVAGAALADLPTSSSD